MLSDEEKKSIEDVMEMIELHKDGCLITTEDDFDNLEILLNLIEKQSKEIEELKKYEKYYEEMEEVNKKFLPVDKIKAKIEEMDNIISQNEEIIFNGRYEHLHTLTEARIVKGEMQSLLEKEE